MAQPRRGKNQARRAGGGGNGAMPRWAWLVIGVALTLLLVLAVPRFMDRGKDGFFHPKPNPDATPQPVSEEAVVDEEAGAADSPARPKPSAAAKKGGNFDFYTLLPGKEVPMSDAELAASEKAEKAQQAKQQKDGARADAVSVAEPSTASTTATASTPAPTRPLPQPVDDSAPAKPIADAATVKPATATPSIPALTPPAAHAAAGTASADNTHYLLQAGAFQATAQADELKAKIALLGLGARVEPAQIGGKTVYRVRMGPYATASDLAEAKRKLAGGGLSAMAVKTN